MKTDEPGMLHVPGESVPHRARPEIKIVAAFVIVLCVVGTPPGAFWAFGGFLLLLAVLAHLADIPAGWLSRRLLIEVPFVALALVLPFTLGGERLVLGGLALSVPGLLAGWNILAKGTLGLMTSLLLAATTAPRELLVGLRRLRTPPMVIMIASLMLRYARLAVHEAGRMRLARISRGDDPRVFWQANATARGIGTLFVRSYERGERVHLAMLSRGWNGRMPEPGGTGRAGLRAWLAGLAPTAPAVAMMGLALWTS